MGISNWLRARKISRHLPGSRPNQRLYGIEQVEERIVLNGTAWLTVIVHGDQTSSDLRWSDDTAAAIVADVNSSLNVDCVRHQANWRVQLSLNDDVSAIRNKAHEEISQHLGAIDPVCGGFLVVDWSDYATARHLGTADDIGARLGLLLGHIIKDTHANPSLPDISNVHLIGFSRGAYVVSTAAGVLTGNDISNEPGIGVANGDPVFPNSVDVFAEFTSASGPGIEHPSVINVTTLDAQRAGFDEGVVRRWGVDWWENYYQREFFGFDGLSQFPGRQPNLNVDISATVNGHTFVDNWYTEVVTRGSSQNAASRHQFFLSHWSGVQFTDSLGTHRVQSLPLFPLLQQAGDIYPAKGDFPIPTISGARSNAPSGARDDFANAPVSAQHLTLSASLSTSIPGAIEYALDSDWFKVRTVRAGNLKAETGTGQIGSNLSNYLAVYDSNLNLIDARTANASGHAARVFLQNVQANQTYYIRVAGVGNSTGSYKLLVSQPESSSSGGDPVDPADNVAPPRVFHDSAGQSFPQARPVALSSINKGDDVGRIEPTDDKDFYRFVVQATGKVEIDVIPQGGLTTLVTFYDDQLDQNGDGQADGVDSDASDSADRISHLAYNVVAGGVYYVSVESKDQNSTGQYELHIRPRDPNNVPGNSGTDGPPGPLPGWGGVRGVQINLDSNGQGASRGSIDDPADVRWFQVDRAQAGNMEVTVLPVNDDLQPFVTVFRANGGGIDTDTGEFDGEARVGFGVGQGERIIVAVSSHNGRSTGGFTLNLSQPTNLPDDDVHDFGETPRDLSAQITQEGDGSFRARIENANDNDWFVMPIRGKGYFTIEIVAQDSAVVPFLELNRDGTSGGFFETDDGRDGRAKITFLPGSGQTQLWAKVSSVDGTQGSYTLNVWRSQNPDDDFPDSGGVFLQAQRLAGGGQIFIPGRIEHPQDSDNFHFRLDVPGPVVMQMIPLTEGFDPFFSRARQHADPNQRTGTSGGGSGRGGRAFEILPDIRSAPDNWLVVDVKSGENSRVAAGDYILHVWQPKSAGDIDADTVGIEASPILLDGTGNGSLPGYPNGSDPPPALNHVGDKDVFQVRAASDRPITFSVSGRDTFLRIYDASGRAIATDHASGPSGASQITLDANRGDLYFLEVTAFNGTDTGDYSIQVTQPTDDHPDAPIFDPKEGQIRDATPIGLVTSNYRTNGSAQVVNGALRLTNDAFQGGTIWFDPLLSSDRFTASFDFELKNQGGIGWGDGFTFAVVDAAINNNQSIGRIGGDLGYAGLSGFAIEFDTYHNFEHDPGYVHVGLDVNGSVTSVAVSNALPFNILDTGTVHAEITYNQGLVTVALSKAGVSKTTVLSAVVPESARPTTGRVGFTGATASAFQRVLVDNFNFTVNGGKLISQNFDGNGFGRSVGRIEVVGDRDLFQVHSTQRGQLTVDVATTDQMLDTFLRIYDSRGNLVAIDDDGGDGRNSHATFTSFMNETYLIEVSGYGDNSVGSYQVTVAALKLPLVTTVGTFDAFEGSLLDENKWTTELRGSSIVDENNGVARLSAQGVGGLAGDSAKLSSRPIVDGNVELDFTADLGAGNNVGILEFNNADTFLRLRLFPDGVGNIAAVVESIGYAQLANVGPQTLHAGATYRLRLTQSTLQTTLSLNGTELARFAGPLRADSRLSTTVSAVPIASETYVLYDDFDDRIINTGNKWNISGVVTEDGRFGLVGRDDSGNRYRTEISTAGKLNTSPPGQPLSRVRWQVVGNSDNWGRDNQVGISDGSNKLYLNFGKTSAVIRQAGGYYGTATDLTTQFTVFEGSSVEFKQIGANIEVYTDNQLRLRLSGKSIRNNSFFFALKEPPPVGTTLEGFGIDNLFVGKLNTASLTIDNVAGSFADEARPILVLYDNFNDNLLDFAKWHVAGTVEEQGGRLRLPVFRNFQPVTGYVSTANTVGGTNLRGFKLNFDRSASPKNLGTWDIHTRFELTNGQDWIRIGGLHKQTFFIETGGAYGSQRVNVTVPSAEIPDGPFEVRERDGNIEVLHNGMVKLTVPNQTVRAGSYFTFQTHGNPHGQSTNNEPQDFEASIDNLEFYVDPVSPDIRVAPSLKQSSDTGASSSDHVTNQLSLDFEWTPGPAGTTYRWREGELLEDGTIAYGSWSALQAETAAQFILPHASIHVFSVQTIDPSGLVAGESSRAIVVDIQGPKVIQHASSNGQFNSWTFVYDEAIDAASVALSDVVSFVGPNGDLMSALTGISSSGNTMTVTFSQQTSPGTYQLIIGPDIRDLAGNLMDQDADGTAGEASEDRFTASTSYVNKVPTISDIANLATEEDTPTDPIAFTVGDIETLTGSLTVSVVSSNQTLVPDSNLMPGGSGANRTLTITPAAHQFGTATITVTVSDGAATASDTFVLTVNAVNDATTISDIADLATDEDTPTDPIAFTVGDVETPAGSLTVSVVSSNQALVPDANLVLGGSEANRTLTITPAANQFGTATITVTVSDGMATASDTFVLTVNPGNHAPTAITLSVTSIDESVLGAVVGTLTVIDADAGDTHNFTVSDSRFEVVGTTLKLKAGQHLVRASESSVSVNVTATDTGDPPLSLPVSFTISVNANEFPWQNKNDRFDANGDGFVNSLDVFHLISEFRRIGSRPLGPRPATEFGLYLDVFGDNKFITLDIFWLISRLRNGPPSGEGEMGGLASNAAEGEGGVGARADAALIAGAGVTPLQLQLPHLKGLDFTAVTRAVANGPLAPAGDSVGTWHVNHRIPREPALSHMPSFGHRWSQRWDEALFGQRDDSQSIEIGDLESILPDLAADVAAVWKLE